MAEETTRRKSLLETITRGHFRKMEMQQQGKDSAKIVKDQHIEQGCGPARDE